MTKSCRCVLIRKDPSVTTVHAAPCLAQASAKRPPCFSTSRRHFRRVPSVFTTTSTTTTSRRPPQTMRTPRFTTALWALLLAGTALAAAAMQQQQTTVTLHVPPTQALPNPRALPPSTHATLTTSSSGAHTAYLTPLNAFVFHNVSEGSYLFDVHCLTHAFPPLRVDVVSVPSGGGDNSQTQKGGGRALKVSAWETFRGNDWDNKGEAIPATGGSLEIKMFGGKAFYMERSSCEYCSLSVRR